MQLERSARRNGAGSASRRRTPSHGHYFRQRRSDASYNVDALLVRDRGAARRLNGRRATSLTRAVMIRRHRERPGVLPRVAERARRTSPRAAAGHGTAPHWPFRADPSPSAPLATRSSSQSALRRPSSPTCELPPPNILCAPRLPMTARSPVDPRSLTVSYAPPPGRAPQAHRPRDRPRNRLPVKRRRPCAIAQGLRWARIGRQRASEPGRRSHGHDRPPHELAVLPFEPTGL